MLFAYANRGDLQSISTGSRSATREDYIQANARLYTLLHPFHEHYQLYCDYLLDTEACSSHEPGFALSLPSELLASGTEDDLESCLSAYAENPHVVSAVAGAMEWIEKGDAASAAKVFIPPPIGLPSPAECAVGSQGSSFLVSAETEDGDALHMLPIGSWTEKHVYYWIMSLKRDVSGSLF